MIRMVLVDREFTRIMIAEKGKNLKDFARNINISQTYLTQILKGTRNPSPTVAYKIAKGLDKEIRDIFLITNVTKDNLVKNIHDRGETHA